MNNLSEFFKKNFHIFLFVILQIVSFIMITKSVKYTQFVVANVCQTIVSPINEGWYQVVRHFSLNYENQQLVQQNIALLNEQDNAFVVKDDSLYTQMQEDTAKRTKVRMYDYSMANIVYKTTDKIHNYIIIDKGKNDGIAVDMAVLSANGVVGVVNDVTAHYASVLSLLHPDASVSAKIQSVNQIGTLIWDGKNARYAQLKDIPQHIPVEVGDTIVTSGYSDIFPKDILIGVVSKVGMVPHSSFLEINVKLATNFNNVNTVYLIRDIYSDEINKLKDNFKDE